MPIWTFLSSSLQYSFRCSSPCLALAIPSLLVKHPNLNAAVDVFVIPRDDPDAFPLLTGTILATRKGEKKTMKPLLVGKAVINNSRTVVVSSRSIGRISFGVLLHLPPHYSINQNEIRNGKSDVSSRQNNKAPSMTKPNYYVR